MESNKRKNDDKNQHPTSKDQQQNRSRGNSMQEQQADTRKHSGNRQEEGGDKYLSNGYLNDKERYDDTEL